MKAILIDDEANCRSTLQQLLEKLCPQVQIVAQAKNADEGMTLIDQYHPDLVFLDIEMPGKNGFELIADLPQVNFDIIFTTAFHEYAVKAFRLSAIDYLLKPIDPDEIVAAVQKVEAKKKTSSTQQIDLLKDIWMQFSGQQPVVQKNPKIALSNQDGMNIVDIQDIIWCEALGSYTKFHLQKKMNIVVSRSIKEYEEILSEYDFIRTHQSYVVNTKQIVRYIKGDGGQVILSDGTEIEVSRRKKEDVVAALNKLVK